VFAGSNNTEEAAAEEEAAGIEDCNEAMTKESLVERQWREFPSRSKDVYRRDRRVEE
jgi:hypothetical protein